MTSEEIRDLAKQVMDGVKMLIAKKLEPLSTRLSAVEVRTGAIAMTRGVTDPATIAEMEALLVRMRKLETLEQRVKALEARPAAPGYKGVWKEGIGFEPGAMVTHGGSLWVCKATTILKPGTSDAWQLAVKRGKDGRDAR